MPSAFGRAEAGRSEVRCVVRPEKALFPRDFQAGFSGAIVTET